MNPCGNKTRHTNRIGCCATCKRLFSSDTAFDKHRVSGKKECVDPALVGLVAVPSPAFPDETIWSWPKSTSFSWSNNANASKS